MIVKECSFDTIKFFIKEYHYLKRMPAGILACFALYDKDEVFPVGGAVFSNGRIQYDKKYIEFARLYLYDEIPKNSETFFIGKCLRLLQKKFPKYEGIVSWSDSNKGHVGTIYKASNFSYDGNSRLVKKYKSNSNRIVYQRTVENENNFEFLGYDKPKKRWIYYFDKKKRERLRKSLTKP